MKLVEIKNQVLNHLYITYNFTTTCNFKCNYCWPDAHDGKYRFPNLEIILKNFDHLLKEYKEKLNKSNIRLHLSGGEPTLWPQIGEFVHEIRKLHNCRLTMATNGSRTLRWWKEYSKYFDDIQISVHNEFADIEHTKIVLDEIYNQRTSMVAAQVLMDPLYWEKSVKILQSLVDHPTPWLVKIMTISEPDSGKIKFYNKNQLEFLQRGTFKRPPQDYIDLMFATGKITEEDKKQAIMIFDNQTQAPYNTFEIVKNNWNRFGGWNCAIGHERLGIAANGTIAGNCGVAVSEHRLNINDTNFIEYFNLDLINPYNICTNYQYCQCSSDIRVSKVYE